MYNLFSWFPNQEVQESTQQPNEVKQIVFFTIVIKKIKVKQTPEGDLNNESLNPVLHSLQKATWKKINDRNSG